MSKSILKPLVIFVFAVGATVGLTKSLYADLLGSLVGSLVGGTLGRIVPKSPQELSQEMKNELYQLCDAVATGQTQINASMQFKNNMSMVLQWTKDCLQGKEVDAGFEQPFDLCQYVTNGQVQEIIAAIGIQPSDVPLANEVLKSEGPSFIEATKVDGKFEDSTILILISMGQYQTVLNAVGIDKLVRILIDANQLDDVCQMKLYAAIPILNNLQNIKYVMQKQVDQIKKTPQMDESMQDRAIFRLKDQLHAEGLETIACLAGTAVNNGETNELKTWSGELESTLNSRKSQSAFFLSNDLNNLAVCLATLGDRNALPEIEKMYEEVHFDAKGQPIENKNILLFESIVDLADPKSSQDMEWLVGFLKDMVIQDEITETYRERIYEKLAESNQESSKEILASELNRFRASKTFENNGEIEQFTTNIHGSVVAIALKKYVRAEKKLANQLTEQKEAAATAEAERQASEERKNQREETHIENEAIYGLQHCGQYSGDCYDNCSEMKRKIDNGDFTDIYNRGGSSILFQLYVNMMKNNGCL